MDVEKILAQLVRIGTVTSADPVKRVARVKFQDTGMTSGQLYVLASRPSGYAAFANHKHDLKIKPWMPKVNAIVLALYLPILDADGFILGEIGELSKLKQWKDQ